MKKYTLIPCIAAILSILCVSCSDGTETTADTETNPVTETEAVTEAAEPSFADFPAQDFGGASVRLGDTLQYDICKFSIREQMNGDVLNDEIYLSHREVEEKLGIKLEYVYFDDPSQLSSAILAGDDACEIMTGQDLAMATLALNGYTMDISELDALDFTAPWWPEHAVNAFRINDSMLLFSNYMSYFGVSRARVYYINKQLCADFDMEVPYEDIFAGTWTMDKLKTMIANVYSDVNGNGQVDMDDVVGFTNHNVFVCMQPSLGIYTFAAENGGALEFVFDQTRASAALEKLYGMLYETGTVYQNTDPYTRNDTTKFVNGTSLFYYDSLGMAETVLRTTDVEYGILCQPKLDETQEDYIAAYTDYLHAVPLTVQDTALVGAAIEALTASGYYHIIPAFIDTSLTNKYTFDTESAKVISLIGEKMYIELAAPFNANMAFTFDNLLNNAKPGKDIASYYAKNEKKDLKLMEEINSLYGAEHE